WMQTPKVLVSRTRTEASYNTRIVGGDNAIEQLAALRAETDGLIGVGGATLATALLRHNLLDEFMLFVHPVVLGTGRPLFDNVLSPIDCDLVEHKTFEHGVTLQRYAIRHPISTARLELRLETTEAVLARIEAMSADDRAQVSAEWLERMRTSVPSPWSHGFEIIDKSTGEAVGSCAFKGPAGPDGAVEIAYQIHPDHRGRGYAKEAARALTDFAFSEGIRLVRAHTLATDGASARVLTAAGFDSIGEVIDPEDGTVWRWERAVRAPH
ncbi:MAG TPA: GNAT family N-acetyltransferase, partial [Polyangia bacterium]